MICEAILRLSYRKSRIPLDELAAAIPSVNRSRLPQLLRGLASQGLLTLTESEILVERRLEVAEGMMRAGFSAERVAELLDWREFEQFSRRALEEHGFKVQANLRFSQGGRRYEIDIVGIREHYLLLVDCKHWRPGRAASYKEASIKQRERMEAASKNGAILGADDRHPFKTRRLPLLVSLSDARVQIIDGTVIVPIFRLNNLLLRLDEFWEELYTKQPRVAEIEDWPDL